MNLSEHLAFDYTVDLSPGKSDFRVTFKKCTRPYRSWKEELYIAAQAVVSRAKKPLWLCFSGGIDSELMCRLFYEQDIPFQVLIIEHKEGTNKHDTRYAIEWCKKRKIEPKIITLDVKHFLEKEIFSYVDQGYVAAHAYFYFQLRTLELVENLGGYAVLGGGEQLYHRNKKPNCTFPCLEFEIGKAASLEWCRKNKTAHLPYFFHSTSELCLSYNQIPAVQFSLRDPDLLNHPYNPYLMKRLVYQSIWTDLVPREKFHGYEGVGIMTAYTHSKLKKILADQLMTYYLPAPEFEMQLKAQDLTTLRSHTSL